MDNYQFPLGSQRLGESLPPNEIHAVSVSLPTWAATLGWATRDEVTLKRMRTGYPRFYIHKLIEALAQQICERLISPLTAGSCHDLKPRVDEHAPQQAQMAMLFPSEIHALQCERYIRNLAVNNPTIVTRTVSLALSTVGAVERSHRIHWEQAELHAVLYPSDLYPLAKDFWQHTGYGISSRYAEFCLRRVDDLRLQPPPIDPKRNHTYNAFSRRKDPMIVDEMKGVSSERAEDEKIKRSLRHRIAKLASSSDIALEEKHVHIFSSGMTAVSTIAQALQAIEGSKTTLNIVAYGFLYLDTFKTLSKVYAFNTQLYGNASSAELDEMESQLKIGYRITALFCEFPGNPLLRTPDLRRLSALAEKYNFLIVCDDTVGTFVNVDVLSHVDIVCTSLTKLFSGGCNVMGGSVILNPQSRRYNELQSALSAAFVDTYFPADAAIMEANSQDFSTRVKRANANAEIVCALLKQHHSVSKVYYPKSSSTQTLYDAFKRPQGGYGYLLSVIFRNPESAIAFFDALDVAKGPSLGTNFTLACPYTLFAHYGEREWAASYEVTEDLVRISVGLEESQVLAQTITVALKAVENLASSDKSRD